MISDAEEAEREQYRREKYTWEAILDGAGPEVVERWRRKRDGDEAAT